MHRLVSRGACEERGSRNWRALLTARRLVLNKMRDIENGLRALLREAGVKLGKLGRKDFAGRLREMCADDSVLPVLVDWASQPAPV